MALDPSKGVKLLGEEENHFNVILPDGNQLTIAKPGLSDEVQEQIRGYEPFEVQGITGVSTGVTNDLNAPEELTPASPSPESPPSSTAQTMPQPQTPQIPSVQVDSHALEDRVTPTAELISQPSRNAVNMQVEGLTEKAQAEKAQADADEKALNARMAAERAFEANTQQLMKHFSGLRDQLANGVADQTIDPNRVWSNAGTSNKIVAMIGLFLGGIGSAIARTENYAFKAFQGVIERDIEAQRLNNSNKNSFYQLNLQALGSEIAAIQASRAGLMAVTAAMLERNAAIARGASAIPNSKILAGQLMLGSNQNIQTMAREKAVQIVQSGKAGGGAGLRENEVPFHQDAETLKRQIKIPELENRTFETNTPEEREEIRRFQKNIPTVKSLLQQLGGLAKNLDPKYKPKKAFEKFITGGSREAQAAKALLAQLQAPAFKLGELGGALTHGDSEQIARFVADPTQIFTNFSDFDETAQRYMNNLYTDYEDSIKLNARGASHSFRIPKATKVLQYDRGIK